jgi:hypothetical protein
MWKLKISINDDAVSTIFSKDGVYAYTTYPSEYIKGVSIPTFNLLSLANEPERIWQQEAGIGGYVCRELRGEIFCTTDNKNLYKLDKNGPSLFMSDTTKGRYAGPNVYLHESPDPYNENNRGKEISLIAVDVHTKDTLWMRPLIGKQSLIYHHYHLRPIDSDFIMITNREGAGFEVLDPTDGSTLWDVTFPTDYKCEGKVIATETHVIYVLTRDMDSTADTKIYVHDRHNGELVRVINDVPFRKGYMMHYHTPTGILYGAGLENIYSIDPVNGESFFNYKIDFGFNSYCLKAIGDINNEIIFLLRADKDRQLFSLVAHFDTTRNEITYHQIFDGSLSRNRNIEVNKGFLFITDTEGTTHIHQWVPD